MKQPVDEAEGAAKPWSDVQHSELLSGKRFCRLLAEPVRKRQVEFTVAPPDMTRDARQVGPFPRKTTSALRSVIRHSFRLISEDFCACKHQRWPECLFSPLRAACGGISFILAYFTASVSLAADVWVGGAPCQLTPSDATDHIPRILQKVKSHSFTPP